MVELEIKAEGFAYEPGDCVGLRFPNPPGLVDSVVACLNREGDADGNAAAEPAAVRDLVDCKELATLSRAAAKALSQHCAEEKDAAELSRMAEEARSTGRVGGGMDVGQVLAAFPSCRPSPQELAKILPPLSSRFYSIASSPLDGTGTISIAYAVAEQSPRGTKGGRRGACTGYLEALRAGRRGDRPLLQVHHRPSGRFRLPDDSCMPLVLVGLVRRDSNHPIFPVVFSSQTSNPHISLRISAVTGHLSMVDSSFSCIS